MSLEFSPEQSDFNIEDEFQTLLDQHPELNDLAELTAETVSEERVVPSGLQMEQGD